VVRFAAACETFEKAMAQGPSFWQFLVRSRTGIDLMAGPPALTQMPFHVDAPEGPTCFSRDGRFLAVVMRCFAGATVFDMEHNAQLFHTGPDRVTGIAFSPLGTYLLTWRSPSRFKSEGLSEAELQVGVNKLYTCDIFSHASLQARNNNLQIWDVASGRKLFHFYHMEAPWFVMPASLRKPAPNSFHSPLFCIHMRAFVLPFRRSSLSSAGLSSGGPRTSASLLCGAFPVPSRSTRRPPFAPSKPSSPTYHCSPNVCVLAPSVW